MPNVDRSVIRSIAFTVSTFVYAVTLTFAGWAAELPDATKKALAKLKVDASIMNGVDAELDVPKAWLQGAAKEKDVIILGTWQEREFLRFSEPFKERYPSIKLNYQRASASARGMKVVIALREGRVIADVTTSIADAYPSMMKIKALADLRELPSFKNLARGHAAADGTWAAFKLSFRCMAYNTNLVKKSDLPKTWDDLLTNPRWRGGKIGLSRLYSTWLLALWGEKGEQWGQQFTRRLFTELDPQQRKEGLSALTALVVAGEFHASIPGPERRAKFYADKGAPVGYHCPIPVPMTLSQIVILEKAKAKNGARIFVNWLLSREGQILQYAASNSVPIHKALRQRAFIPFADTVMGKPSVVRNDALLGSDMDKALSKTWKTYWTKPVGKGHKRGKRRKKKQ